MSIISSQELVLYISLYTLYCFYFYYFIVLSALPKLYREGLWTAFHVWKVLYKSNYTHYVNTSVWLSHGHAADIYHAYHINMDQNLWGMFPTPCSKYLVKN